jgi:hypothetical protein
VKAVLDYPDRDVLVVWPTYADPWAHEAIVEMRPGRTLYYVGEGGGGCCADDWFHDLLKCGFINGREVSLPQWYGLHDYLWVGTRREYTPNPTPHAGGGE